MKKVLDFDDTPIIDTYSNQANIVAIISKHDQLKSWILTRFIRIAYANDNNYLDFCDGDYFDYYRCRTKYCDNKKYFLEYSNHNFLSEEDVTNEILNDNLCDTIIEYINKGAYITIHLNHFYIEGSDAFHKFQRNHQAIIFGYDLGNKQFYVADNFVQGKYLTLKVNFIDLVKARRSSENIELKAAIKIVVLPDSRFTLDYTNIYNILVDYISGTDRSNYGLITHYDSSTTNQYSYSHHNFVYDFHYKHEGFLYGHHTYKQFHKAIAYNMEHGGKLDIRSYHLMCNHKAVLKTLFACFVEEFGIRDHNGLLQMFDDISTNCMKARNYVLKYNLTADKRILKKVDEIYKNIELSEKDAILTFLDELSKKTKDTTVLLPIV
ncbi:hypothetical protein DFQ01_112145 [Paenibacillus cellulosilyticus]|uniref:Butirosin biosynthesis protein H-like n=1 Tax=Paenibacillus cellulosilyticus TaxID=375489 RepID=A0A2V2YRZ9_9BACL|nr:hypothetical protein [Paenibacillus cellulosilyticus]PWW00792.1 hypothetical protein DFQ01_112145 [Paenibacillus cellulosilyticus]QKS45645.1 hypothetical protein HUB94_15280 [Paenibacillus cellulosilyticus]